ncbi:MAG: MurR/RpiR family transcriptional regulator [Sarcina sp.]
MKTMLGFEDVNELNELELEVYKYIVNNKKTVVYMRIRELADEIHVSTTTILRFCKKLNCAGFSEFKIKLKMELEETDVVEIRDDKSVIIEFLNRTETEGFKKDIEDSVSLMEESNPIICIGFGNSGELARYAARHFSGVGKFTVPVYDPYYPTEHINGEKAMALFFSVEGEGKDGIRHLNELKKRGVKIVSITNSKSCTIAKLSDINISYYVQMQKHKHHQLTTQVPVMYIIEALAKELSELKKAKV